MLVNDIRYIDRSKGTETISIILKVAGAALQGFADAQAQNNANKMFLRCMYNQQSGFHHKDKSRGILEKQIDYSRNSAPFTISQNTPFFEASFKESRILETAGISLAVALLK